MDPPIFGLRFGANSALQPTREELTRFLETPKSTGGARQKQDLAPFREMLETLASVERDRTRENTPDGVRDRMLYGVLGHSSFFHASLLTALEQYKYHLHAFLSLDFRKPSAFIASAEEEISRLDPRRKQDAAKQARLQDLANERRSAIAALTKRRAELSAELLDIAGYISDNLRLIADRCETAIVVLVHLQVSGNEESMLIDDIKERFKEELRAALHEGVVTREDLDAAKEHVAVLSREISALLREDVYALNTLYEALHERAQSGARRIEDLLRQIKTRRESSIDEEGKRLSAIEQALVSFASDLHFPLNVAAASSATAYQHLLVEKRAEMLDKLFALLQQERRLRTDRRSDQERGTFSTPAYDGPDRRSGKARRRSDDRP